MIIRLFFFICALSITVQSSSSKLQSAIDDLFHCANANNNARSIPGNKKRKSSAVVTKGQRETNIPVATTAKKSKGKETSDNDEKFPVSPLPPPAPSNLLSCLAKVSMGGSSRVGGVRSVPSALPPLEAIERAARKTVVDKVRFSS